MHKNNLSGVDQGFIGPQGVRIFATVFFVIASCKLALTQQAAVYEGFTKPHYDIMVAATEIGLIEEVLVEEGEQVKKGQVIACLEDSVQRASVKIAELQAKMKGESDAAKAEAFLHRSKTLRLRELAKEKMARPDELLRSEADLEIAEARQRASMEQERLRELELERYKAQLERRKVRAPMDGLVAKVLRAPGEYVTPSDPAVIRLLVRDHLFADFSVPAEEALNMSVGTRVRVFLRSTAKSVNASIHSISPSIDGESGTLEVRVKLPNPYGEVRDGDRCTMQIAPNKRSARLPGVNTNPNETDMVMQSRASDLSHGRTVK